MGALGSLIPTVLLFVFLGCFAWVGYQMYIFANDLTNKGKEHMAKNNINFSGDGMKIGVKKTSNEDLEGKQQSVLYNMWNHTSFPGYKSRIWKTTADEKSQPGTPTGARPSTPRQVTPSSIRQRS